MKTITFTEFRQQASVLFTNVERGETYVVIRHGKPIAEIIPYVSHDASQPNWKRPGLRLQIQGAALSAAILAERAEES